MNFGQAISSGFTRYVQFEGRSSRSEYWYWFLFNLLVGFVLGFFRGFFAVVSPDTAAIFTVLTLIVDLALFLPSLAVFVRRMHDVNRSGWWYFIAFTIIGLIPLIIWLCQRGDTASNRFGADPFGVQAPADHFS